MVRWFAAALALSACTSKAPAPPPRVTQVPTSRVPRWFVDPSLHPRFGRGMYLTASANGTSEAEARINAMVQLLRQLGGVEGTGGAVHVPTQICSVGDLRLETVVYKPFALSWRYVRLEEGRLGTAYYAFAYLERREAAHALGPVLAAAMTRYANAREQAIAEAEFEPARDAYSAAAGLALELGNITGNRATLDALNEDFITLQTRRALIESGCASRPDKTMLSL